MNKKAVITGGSGYYGEILVSKLLQNSYECTIIDCNEPIEKNANTRFVKADICDIDRYSYCLQGADVVFHNVACVPLHKNDQEFYRVNRLGTEHILNASIRCGVKQFVYTSSSAVYGIPKENPVNELSPKSPFEKYGFEKLKGEELCLSKKGLIDVKIIRPRTIVSAGRYGIFSILFEWIKEGNNVPVFDGGHNIYQFVHAEDLAEATVLISENGKYVDYNVGTMNYCSLKETIEFIIEKSSSSSKIISLNAFFVCKIMDFLSSLGISPLGPYHSKMYGQSLYFDNNRITQELGWKSKHNNKTMLLEGYLSYIKSIEQNFRQGASVHQKPLKSRIMKVVGKLLSLYG